MKHSIRQRVLDPVTGLKVTKLEQVNGELGSGLYDRNGKEIFEGDRVQYVSKYELRSGGYNTIPGNFIVQFNNGAFWAGEYDYLHIFIHDFKDTVEVIGHVEDAK